MNYLDYGARMYDPDLGRWMTQDPLAEMYANTTPYAFSGNNPVRYVDLNGMSYEDLQEDGNFYDDRGNYLGTDGIDDEKMYVIKDRKEAREVMRADRSGGLTEASSLSSAFELPSTVALTESLNVLDRTIANGGLREESSFVMKDGSVVHGKQGEEMKAGANVVLGTFPLLPAGSTTSDVEATIHSHPTAILLKDGIFSHGDAKVLGPFDESAFAPYRTNIVVGPLGQFDQDSQGNAIPKPNGVVFYDNQANYVSELERKAIERILR